VGSAVVRALRLPGFRVRFTGTQPDPGEGYEKLILTGWSDLVQLNDLIFDTSPGIIINCLLPEDREDYFVNSAVPAFLTGHRAVIHLSTNAVFSDSRHPWGVHDLPCPVGKYGESKYLGERPESQLVIRTSVLGWRQSARITDIAQVIQRYGTKRGLWNGVTNHELARFICEVCCSHQVGTGIIHLCSPPESWEEIALMLASKYQIDLVGEPRQVPEILLQGTERKLLEEQIKELPCLWEQDLICSSTDRPPVPRDL